MLPQMPRLAARADRAWRRPHDNDDCRSCCRATPTPPLLAHIAWLIGSLHARLRTVETRTGSGWLPLEETCHRMAQVEQAAAIAGSAVDLPALVRRIEALETAITAAPFHLQQVEVGQQLTERTVAAHACPETDEGALAALAQRLAALEQLFSGRALSSGEPKGVRQLTALSRHGCRG